MLLAYGKKHISLLRSLVADRGSVVPLHTILEVFRWGRAERMGGRGHSAGPGRGHRAGGARLQHLLKC